MIRVRYLPAALMREVSGGCLKRRAGRAVARARSIERTRRTAAARRSLLSALRRTAAASQSSPAIRLAYSGELIIVVSSVVGVRRALYAGDGGMYLGRPEMFVKEF